MKNLHADSISMAAYFLGPKNIKLITYFKDEETGKFVFEFDVDEQDGKKYIIEYGSSESRAFDQAVQYIKNLVFKNNRPRRAEK